ncbi:hypothetical protein [Pediococcus argentinicus]|nr:hypothetical protein [Pediococcus argentinicus]
MARYIFRMILQTIFVGLLVYFFNADSNMVFHFQWGVFTIWLLISWISQFWLMKYDRIFPSFSFQGSEDTLKKADNPTVVTSGTQYRLGQDQINFGAAIVLYILSALLGPIILLVRIGLDSYLRSRDRK